MAGLNALPESLKEVVQFPVSGISSKVMPLQAADLLAYETLREVKARFDDEPARLDLLGLLSGTPHVATCTQMPLLPPGKKGGMPKLVFKQFLFKRGKPLRGRGLWGV